MPELIWNNVGERYFEVGVDRGVFYTADGTGIAWNGLTAVTESPSGGVAIPYYLDGVKYLNIADRKEFNGKIEAFTYPDEFSEYEGWVILENGIAVDEQQIKAFGLSYRTLLGNDLDGQDHGYKIHIVYNALATPTESAYSSIGDNSDPSKFSWAFTTTPIKTNSNLTPLSHMVVDSTKTNPTQLRFIENYIYGSETLIATLPSPDQLFDWFARPMGTFIIDPDPVTGLSLLVESNTLSGDLRGRSSDGLYVLGDYSRIFELGPIFDGINVVDGGNASTNYTGLTVIDGGNASTNYNGLPDIDGGYAEVDYYPNTMGLYYTDREEL